MTVPSVTCCLLINSEAFTVTQPAIAFVAVIAPYTTKLEKLPIAVPAMADTKIVVPLILFVQGFSLPVA